MRKTLEVARREFIATVATKGFVIGLVIMPLLLLVVIIGFRLLLREEAPRVEAEVAVMDPTGEVIPGLRQHLSPEALAERRDDFTELMEVETPEAVRKLASATGSEEKRREALAAVLGKVPKLEVTALPPGTDLEDAKTPLTEGDVKTGGRLALVVIHPDAVARADGAAEFGSYDLYVREKLDTRLERELKDAIGTAIVDARVRLAGLDRDQIDTLTRVAYVCSKTVTRSGEEETNRVLNELMPAAFMLLLFVSVMTSGQSLLTTMVEEKTSRVVEVLLSAVSPMQLMAGKILGQMGVGFLLMAFYAAMGLTALITFAALGVLDLKLLVYLVLFYLIAHFVVGSLMAAIGASVSELRDAQNLMGPVMVTLMVPWLLWLPISRSPSSAFAVLTSFLPPINPFVMLIRMASTEPPPWWQVWLSILIGAASVYGALWFAAKIFRIGLLMHGKPPTLRTLVRWARMA